jgi:PAS domain-containing protein
MPVSPYPEIYRDILDALQIGVGVLDSQKRIVFWSGGPELITGCARIDVVGHLCTDNILQHCNQNCCEMCAEKSPVPTALHAGKPLEVITSFITNPGIELLSMRGQSPCAPARLDHRRHSELRRGSLFEWSAPPNDQRMKEPGWLDPVTDYRTRQ